MFVVSNTNECCVNVAHVIDFFLQSEDIVALLANSNSKNTVIVARYQNKIEAQKALEFMISRLSSNEQVIRMPDSQTVKGLLVGNSKTHHPTGKKTKGYGKS